MPKRSPTTLGGSRAQNSASQIKSLPSLLLAEGKASKEQIQRALEIQKETGVFLGEILIAEGILDEQSFITLLAKNCKIPHLSLLDYLIDENIVGLIPKEVCMKYRLLPIDKLGNNLTVAMVNPLNAEALEEVRRLCPDLRIKPILCANKHFEVVTAKIFAEGKKKSGPVELTATSFGLSRPAPAASASPPAASASPPAASASPPAAAPAAPSSEFVAPPPPPMPVLDSGIRSAEKVGAGMQQANAMIDSVFGLKVEDVVGENGAAEEGKEAPPATEEDEVIQEVANAMMESMRDTYEVLARRMELFRNVDAENVAKIFASGITDECEEGQTVFEKGEVGHKLYVILSGTVKIVDPDENREIAVLTHGDMFGEMALVSNEPRSATAIAVEASSLLGLSVDAIYNCMPQDVAIKLLVNIVVTLSGRLRLANEG